MTISNVITIELTDSRLHWFFTGVHRLSLVVASGDVSWLQCAGFGSCDPQVLGRRLNSCGARA